MQQGRWAWLRIPCDSLSVQHLSLTRSGCHPWLVLLLLLQAPVGQLCANAAECKDCNGVQVQGKNRELVAETARKLGLDGTYIPRSYIEQV